jgi:SAM-dependent methyltransferase
MIPETKGWAMIAFPCFSRITFMHFDIPLFQNYPQILQRLREGEKFMDVGCGLGQQLRFLAYQGVSTENLFGVDISKPFVDLGYKLFKDSETFKATFILSDLLEPGPELDSVRGQISIMFAGFFFHLWDWDRQLKAAKHLVALLKPQKGSVIAGMQVGSMTHSGNWYDRPNPEYGPMFVHSLGSKLGGRQARIGK